jgi:hypothetical protein
MIPREYSRRKVLWNAEVRRGKGHPMKCQVLDIAAGGAKIRTDARFSVGSTVELIVGQRGAVFPSKVLWQRENHAGICFLEDPWTVQARLDEAMPAKLEPTA